jgi:hypothetical protein
MLSLFGCGLSLLLLGLLASGFAEESVPLEEIEVFLEFAALRFVKGKL